MKKTLLTSALALFVTTAIATAEDPKPAAPVTAEAKHADVKAPEVAKDAKPAEAAKPADATKPADAAKPADAKDAKAADPKAAKPAAKKGGHHHHRHHGVDMKAACAATKALNAQTGAYVAPTMPAPMPTAAHVEAAPVAPAHVEAAPVAPATMPAAPAAH